MQSVKSKIKDTVLSQPDLSIFSKQKDREQITSLTISDTVNKKTETKQKTKQNTKYFDKDDIIKRFDLGFEPLAISFREKQTEEISLFLDEALKNRIKCRCLLLTGMPGAGKSSLAKKVVKERAGIRTISMTASTSISMSQFIMDLSYEIMGSKLRLHQLITYLEKRKAYEKICVIIDEFDSLFKNTTSQYLQIFKVFTLPIEGITLIATSNSIQMMQNLSFKHNLSLPIFKNIVFSQYKVEQIRSIIQQRINDVKINLKVELSFQQLALKYCATKIYNYKGGDIRFVLEQIKQIVTNTLESCTKSQCLVQFEDASSVLSKFNKFHETSEIMRGLPFLQALALIALNELFKDNEILETVISVIFKKIEEIRKVLKLNRSSYCLIDILRYLEVYDFVGIRERKKILYVSLKSSSAIIKNAYEDDLLLGRYFWE